MNNQLVIGSLGQIAQSTGQSLAETFLSADALILLDESGSMGAADTLDGKTRREVARNELVRLQKSYPGKIALIAFSNYPVFCPSGIPVKLDGSTNLYGALEYIKPADDCGMKIIIISDGIPSRPEDCIKLAKSFKNKLDVIFIGNETDYQGGREFLQRLANATGGEALKSDAPGLLGDSVEKLLLSSG